MPNHVRHDQEKNSGLQSYLRNMMRVMNLDVERRGRQPIREGQLCRLVQHLHHREHGEHREIF